MGSKPLPALKAGLGHIFNRGFRREISCHVGEKEKTYFRHYSDRL